VPRSRFRLPMSYQISCSDDGNAFVCLGRRLNIYDVAKRERISTCRPFSHPFYSAFSPDGKTLAVKNTSGRIYILDPSTGEILHDHKNQKEGEGCEVLFSPDGGELIDASWEGTIRIRKANERTIVTQEQFPGEMIARITHDSIRRTWLIQHDPKVLQGENWASYNYLELRKWPFAKRKAKLFSFGCYIRSATLSPEASRILFICTPRGSGRSIRIASTTDGKILASSSEIKTGGTGSELAWSVDCKYAGSIQARRFVFYRASDLSIVGEVPCQYPSSICFLPHDNQIAIGSWSSSVIVELNDVLAGTVKMP
jgi:WD40 repeat protein